MKSQRIEPESELKAQITKMTLSLRAETSRDATQDLIDCARGSALVLRSLFSHADQLEKHDQIISGLADALKIVVDHADVAVFNCAGELSDSVEPNLLAKLLEANAAKLRERTLHDHRKIHAPGQGRAASGNR